VDFNLNETFSHQRIVDRRRAVGAGVPARDHRLAAARRGPGLAGQRAPEAGGSRRPRVVAQGQRLNLLSKASGPNRAARRSVPVELSQGERPL